MSERIDIQELKRLAEAAHGVSGHSYEAHKAQADYSAASRPSTILALIEIAEAAQDVLSSLEYDQSSYDRNGPGFTSPSGTQYELTADVLACSEERAARLRTALEGVKK